MILALGEHAREDFEAQVLLVAQAVCAPLDDAHLRITKTHTQTLKIIHTTPEDP